MAAAGLTHGGFYAHFSGKDDLVVAAIAQAFDDARARFAAAMEGRDAAEGLARYIDVYLSRRHRDERASGCPLPALSGDLARLGPAARAAFGEGVASLTRRLAAALEPLGVEPAEPLALALLSELTGALVLARSVEDRAQSDAILAASRAAAKRRMGMETHR